MPIYAWEKSHPDFYGQRRYGEVFSSGRLCIRVTRYVKMLWPMSYRGKRGLAFLDWIQGIQPFLITGGSLGARSVNEAIDTGIPLLIKNQIQLIWQTGKSFAAQAAAHAVESKLIWTGEFISTMEFAYAAADIVVSRSGSVLYELCAVQEAGDFYSLSACSRRSPDGKCCKPGEKKCSPYDQRTKKRVKNWWLKL